MRASFKSPLVIAVAIVLLGVLSQALAPIDHMYWNVWFKNRAHPSESNAAIVSLDNGEQQVGGNQIASPAMQAQILSILADGGARRIYFDLPNGTGQDPAGVAALEQTLVKQKELVTLVRRARVDPASQTSIFGPSQFAVPAGMQVAASAWDVNFVGYAEHSKSAFTIEGKRYPAVSMAGVEGLDQRQSIYPDFAFSPRSVPTYRASDLLSGKTSPREFAGRRVFVTTTNLQHDTVLGYFGQGRVPAALVDIAGYKGLMLGKAVDLGWIPSLLLFVAAVRIGSRRRDWRGKLTIYSSLIVACLIGSGLLREHNVVLNVGPALGAMLIYAPLRSSQKWRNRVQQTSSASGLPNISAMAEAGVPGSQDVIAVSIAQYEQMLASLPRELHGECARQVARRLSFGGGDRAVFDNDNGLFVWLEDSQTLDGLVEHLEGLRALFSSPLVIDGHVLDTTVHFGIDRNTESRAMSRIKSALASAQEAQGKGKLYEEFGEQRLAESSWELSLHARIDEGLKNGDIWLALQPQYDFRSNRLSGAEALIRWNDPQRGVIPPDAFILQAERAGRIEAITYWVLEKSIRMLRQFNAVAAPFQISVNLSARMVDHPALVHRVADIVRGEGLEDCGLITFEVTETFSMTNREQAKRNLAALRTMGFRLSIDDFGTGQASLAYLAEIPSDEVKLDRRFIQSIVSDPRERLIVDSVIKLAHALGQEVVAEGIEDIVTLGVLRDLDCDLAQGYHIGRPVRPDDLLELLDSSQPGTSDRRAVNL